MFSNAAYLFPIWINYLHILSTEFEFDKKKLITSYRFGRMFKLVKEPDTRHECRYTVMYHCVNLAKLYRDPFETCLMVGHHPPSRYMLHPEGFFVCNHYFSSFQLLIIHSFIQDRSNFLQPIKTSDQFV